MVIARGIAVTLLGKLPNSAGDHVVACDGWPLYRCAADKAPGQHRAAVHGADARAT
ncbi:MULTISPECIES: hypothetical protein [unclassified Streptomyces]|uniref:hypothetical protein n=1 Tax=unclassified Streptomyces TaxID=2593676 RepID=UPI00344AB21F